MTSYQKCKAENERLKRIILDQANKMKELVVNPNSFESLCIKSEIKIALNAEKVLWYGDLQNGDNKFTGLLQKCK